MTAPVTATGVPLLIENLVKRFGSVVAVDGVSLALRAGECLGLLGPNGAGKSTTIRCIVGRVLPNSGSATVFGSPAASPDARAALGWIPQELALYPRLTCAENLESFGRYHGLAGTALHDAVRWCLQWAALEDRRADLVQQLSGGMKRRLNMAAGLIHRPKVVLMDEPTVGVDPQSRNRIFEMIEQLRLQGMSVIYTTHYMEEAERLCDRIAIIDHGRVIALGTKDELVHASFASQTQVIARFAAPANAVSDWVAQRGGRWTENTAQFTLGNAAQIAALLDAAQAAHLELVDLAIKRPNLESVFLQLTGRELRD